MSITEIFDSMEYGPAPETASPAIQWLESHGRQFGMFIAGEWTQPSADSFQTYNPANKQPLARVSQAGSPEIDHAVEAARAAQPVWFQMGGHRRAAFLYAIARQIQKHARLFAVLETLDNGKPIRETRDIDIPLVSRHFYHHAGWAQVMDRELPGYEPIGVCGQIIPWNFPLLMLSWKIAPALAMGNTVVLKPAEFTPLTALLFAEICVQIGLPRGVVNIVTGDGESGRLIVEHPDVDKIAFTGSTEVGRMIRKATAGTGKKLSLELGGKSPYVVFEDADQDSAIEGLVDAIWFNQGQVCCAGSRLLVQESIATRFLEKLKLRMSTLRVGDPLDKSVDIGAIIERIQLERIQSLVAQGVAEGAEMYQPSGPCPTSGWFYPPTLLSNVGPASTVAQVEIFGPVLVAMTFRTPAEAVALANNTPYGLASSVWTENLALAHDIAAKIKAGTVWVNCTNQFDAASGFGGYRESGFGREGGREGLLEYAKPPTPTTQTSTFDARSSTPNDPPPTLDTTHKLYIGGKQARPDGGYSIQVAGQEFALANRKDVRNAVEAAATAQAAWAGQSGHLRAQVLYYLAENLENTRGSLSVSPEELSLGIQTLFDFAAMADKFDGQVHGTPFKGVTYTLNEPIGVVSAVLPDQSALLALLSAIGAAIAMGNAIIAIPSRANPLPAAQLYRILEASDVPAGVVNILTGEPAELAAVLADHDGVDAIWCFREDLGGEVESRSAGNLKQTWATTLPVPSDVRTWLRHSTQVKNVWIPMGE
ncbi:MAG: aldehyde dehydrogenase family protein [Fimbriimonadaceae bacterium]|nr:aldehyde dehydrogenase family protein [Fimbriimonadaceae bacterium]